MAKSKKPEPENRKTPRVNVGVPEPWHAVMRKIAAQKRQPVIYTIIEMVIAEAKARGIECPVPPWEPEGEE